MSMALSMSMSMALSMFMSTALSMSMSMALSMSISMALSMSQPLVCNAYVSAAAMLRNPTPASLQHQRIPRGSRRGRGSAAAELELNHLLAAALEATLFAKQAKRTMAQRHQLARPAQRAEC